MQRGDSFGILMVNTGIPEEPRPRAVRTYLAKFLMDRRIAPMNRLGWWLVLHLLSILPERGRKASAARYAQHLDRRGLALHHRPSRSSSTGSPAALAAEGGCRRRRRAPRHELQRPSSVQSACDALSRTRAARHAGRASAVPPERPHSTTGSVHDGVERAVKKTGWKGTYDFIDNYHDNPMYVKALAASIQHAGFDPESDDQLLLSFHSIPLKDIEAGDTYELQTGASSLQIASELGIDRKRWTIGYQCRFDKGREWLSPYTTEVLARWAEAREGRVFFVCPGFAVDCLETIYDVEPNSSRSTKRRRGQREIRSEMAISYTCRASTAASAHAKVLADVVRSRTPLRACTIGAPGTSAGTWNAQRRRAGRRRCSAPARRQGQRPRALVARRAARIAACEACRGRAGPAEGGRPRRRWS